MSIITVPGNKDNFNDIEKLYNSLDSKEKRFFDYTKTEWRPSSKLISFVSDSKGFAEALKYRSRYALVHIAVKDFNDKEAKKLLDELVSKLYLSGYEFALYMIDVFNAEGIKVLNKIGFNKSRKTAYVVELRLNVPKYLGILPSQAHKNFNENK